MTLREQLLSLCEPQYCKFTSALMPGVEHVLGIRLPILRKIAREIACGEWRDFLSNAESYYFEERMIQGLMIGYVRCPTDEKIDLMRRFIPKIDNWAVCDSFCMTRLRAADREAVWHFAQPYFLASGEYEVRFAVVTALANFIDIQHLDALLELLGKVRHEGYYARMGVAWAVSVCYVKFPEQTRAWLDAECPLDDWTFNKSLQKIVESYRVTDADKAEIRTLKRQKKVQ